jgi:methionyl-tRNA formyltransferase
MPSLRKYVFILDDPFYLPRVLDKYLREYHDSTVGVNVQPTVFAKHSRLQTARTLLSLYGPRYFCWKLWRMAAARAASKIINGCLRSYRRCYSVAAVARKYGVPIDLTDNVNGDAFLGLLRERNVELIVSISGRQFYGKLLREQTPRGIINCHGALLPKYRGLMPSFWTLANRETEGGVSVHFVDGKIDNGPIVVQRRYRIHPSDTLEDVLSRSKDLGAEAVIDAVRLIEEGRVSPIPNPEEAATCFSIPTKEDVRRFRASGHRFF